RSQTPRLSPSAGPRRTPGTARVAARMPDPRTTLDRLWRGIVGTGGDRNRGLSAADSTAALSTGLSPSGAADGHRAGRAQADPQGAVGRLGLGRDPARQV